MQVTGPGDREGGQRPYFGTVEENKGLKVTPVNAAATDPAALPGLVPSPPDDPEEEKLKDKDKDEATATDTEESEESEEKEEARETEEESETDADAARDSEGSEDSEDSEATDADADTADDDGDSDSATDTDTAAEAGDDDGPVFEAADRRGSVTVDSTGVRFQLDDTEAEFTWPEIGAVEYKTSRFGRRLILSVHDSRGICPAEVEAPDKATLKEWATVLESALDAYFEEASP